MPRASFDSIARIDLSVTAQIRQLESVRPGLMKQLVEKFEGNARKFFDDIAGHIASGDMETLRIGFHSMKGTAGSLGAQRLSHIAAVAERVAGGDDTSMPLADVVAALKTEFDGVRGELADAARS